MPPVFYLLMTCNRAELLNIDSVFCDIAFAQKSLQITEIRVIMSHDDIRDTER